MTSEESHAGVIRGLRSDRGDDGSGHWTFGDSALISATSPLSRHFAIKRFWVSPDTQSLSGKQRANILKMELKVLSGVFPKITGNA